MNWFTDLFRRAPAPAVPPLPARLAPVTAAVRPLVAHSDMPAAVKLIIDLAVDPTPKLAALASANVGTIFGYLSSINPSGPKCWTPDRVKTVAVAHIRIGLVHEGWGGVGGKGISSLDGLRDGKYCHTRARELGAPKGTCVYFACDDDFNGTQIINQVIPYFEEICGSFADGFYRIGVYGSGAVCAAIMQAELADLTWLAQSRGWSGYAEWKPKADMVQGPQTHISGLDVDSNVAQGDIGDYVPDFSGAAS